MRSWRWRAVGVPVWSKERRRLRRYSPLVGVGVDEDGEESESVDKLAVVMRARQVRPTATNCRNGRGGEKLRASARGVDPAFYGDILAETGKQLLLVFGRGSDPDCRGRSSAYPEWQNRPQRA